MTIDIMLDLETMGTQPNAAIVAIGAVAFDAETLHEVDHYYCVVSLQSCLDSGLQVSGETVRWWLTQSEPARKAISGSGMSLIPALIGLRSMVDMLCTPSSGLWGNGASFDNVIIRSAFAAAKMDFPLPFWSDRCFRTVKALAPRVEVPREGTHHNALDDARHQLAVLRAIRGV